MHNSLSPVRQIKDSIFYGQTTSLCEVCLKLVPAKILIQGSSVYYLKRCNDHGEQKTLVSTDIAYFKKCKEVKNPYPKKKKKAVGINLSPAVIDYFKKLADESGISYQKLIDLYILECVKRKKNFH